MRDVQIRQRASLSLAAACAVAVLSASSVQAANRYWVGGDASDPTGFEVAGNWSNGVPTNNDYSDVAVFREASSPANKTPTLTMTRRIGGLNFENSVGWVLDGAFTLQPGSGGISSTGAGTNTINAALNPFSNGPFFIGEDNLLIVNGSISFNGNSSQTSKTGAGTIRFRGGFSVSSSTRPFTIRAGTVEMEATSQNGRYLYVTGNGSTLRSYLNEQYANNDGNYIAVDNGGLFDLNGKTEVMRDLYVGSATGLLFAAGSANGTSIGGLGGGSVTIGEGSLTTNLVRLKGGSISSTGAGQLTAASIISEAWTTSSTISGRLSVTSGSFVVDDGDADTDLDVSAVISGSAGMKKSGAGTLRLSGSNIYTGSTTITQGTLDVANTTGSATGAGAVAASTNAVITGAGTIGGTLTIADDSTLRPGSDSDGLSVGGGLSFQLGSGTTGPSLSIDLLDNSTYGRVTVTGGDVSLGEGIASLVLSADFSPTTPGQRFWIIDNTGEGALTGTFSGLANGDTFTLPGGEMLAIYYGANHGAPIGLDLSGGNDVALVVVVPEPSTALAGMALLAGLGLRRRRHGAANLLTETMTKERSPVV